MRNLLGVRPKAFDTLGWGDTHVHIQHERTGVKTRLLLRTRKRLGANEKDQYGDSVVVI